MNQEHLPAEFYKHFYQEELYAIPEKISNVPVSKSVPEPAQNEVAAPLPVQVPAPVAAPVVQKKAGVIVNMLEQEFAGLRDHQMLMRLLAAIKLSPEDVAFINLTSQVTDLDKLEPGVQFEQAILFLAPNHPLALHHKLVPFQMMKIQNKYVLLGAELSALSANRELKERLWTGLQAMFL